MRVVIAEDSVLLREGLARLLAEAGHDVVAAAGEAEEFLRQVGEHLPDVVVVSDSSGNVSLVLPPGNTLYRVSASTSSGGPPTVTVPTSSVSRHVITVTDQSGDISVT